MAKFRERYRNVLGLGLTSFLTDVSTEMVLGLLPVFLVVDLAASKAILGLIEGAAEGFNNFARMIGGVASDSVGKRKVFVFAGYALSTAAKPFLALAHAWPDALVIRVGDRIGKGVRTPPRDALLSDSVVQTHVGRAFGIHRSLDQVGAIVGPSTAFLLLPFLGVRNIFLLSLLPGAVALFVLWRFVAEKSTPGRQVSLITSFRGVLHGRFLWVLLFVGIFGLGAYNFSFVLIRSLDLGVAAATIPLVYAVINVSHTTMGVPAGSLSDRLGREASLALGYVLFLVSSVLAILLSGSALYAFLIAGVYGLYVGTVETAQRALIPKYVQSELRATAYGVFNLIVGVTALAANIIVGTLWDLQGPDVAFTYSIIAASAGTAGVLGLAVLRK